MMDMDELERLVELMNSNDLVEVEIESETSRIRLKKAGAEAPVAMTAHAPVAIPAPAPAAAAAPAPAPTAGDAAAASGVEGDSITFNSPMVGTFYRASSPTAEPFVKVGDKVGSSTVLCIVEAMKVMNEITADTDGEILEILVGDGEAVEYGQPLFTLRPR